RILLSDEGEVYLKIDEETFGSSDAIRMMFRIASEESQSNHKRTTNIEIALRKLVRRSIRKSVIPRLISWMKLGGLH
ncbi:MAG: hypothetical protein ACPID1_07135, partial [Poseidonia sp.]